MRVLLVNPPVAGAYVDRRQRCTGDVPEGWAHPPIGQAYIASAVQKWNGCETKIIDAVTLNLSARQFVDEARKWKPDVVVSVVGAFTYPSDLNILSMVKSATGATIIVFGEIVSAIAAQLANEYANVDFFVRGDPEWPVSKIIENKRGKCQLKDLPAVTFKAGGEVRENPTAVYPHLDTLPFPDRELIDNLAYKCMPFVDGKFTDIITSRGCPAKCTFCTSQKFWGRVNRDRSAENVLAEVEHILGKYGITNLFITDETFSINKKRLRQILPQFKKWGIKFAIQTRVDTINRDIIREMADSGCIYIHYGIESGTQRMLDYYKKGITVNKSEEAVRWTKEAGIPVHGTFILGNPVETPEEIEATIAFAKKLDLDFYHFGPLIPFPLSEVYNDLDAQGKLKHKDFTRYKKPNIVYEMENLTEDQVQYYLKKIYKETIFTPRYVYKRLKWLLGSRRGLRGIKEMIVGGMWVMITYFKKAGKVKSEK